MIADAARTRVVETAIQAHFDAPAAQGSGMAAVTMHEARVPNGPMTTH